MQKEEMILVSIDYHSIESPDMSSSDGFNQDLVVFATRVQDEVTQIQI